MQLRKVHQMLLREVSLHRTYRILTQSLNQSCRRHSTVCSRLVSSQSLRWLPVSYSATNFKGIRLMETQTQHTWFHSRLASTQVDAKVAPLFVRVAKFGEKLAIVSHLGHYTYNDLMHYSSALAKEIKEVYEKNISSETNNDSEGSLVGERIAFLCENDMSYVVTLFAIWMCGGIAVPLSKFHPASELEYFITDSGAKLLISTDAFEFKLRHIASNLGLVLKVLDMDDYSGDYDERGDHVWTGAAHTPEEDAVDHDEYRDKNAMIIYTSGTTGRPKGVVHTFGNIDAQIKGMIEAWGWKSDDVILHVLPLHHVHGIVNVLLTPLYCGATCVIMNKFDPEAIWSALLNENTEPAVNMFMAVPTVYAKLLENFYHNNDEENGKLIPDNVKDILKRKLRLMVSGSAALPQPIMEKWEELTGHTLLERYGMTEIGMALTNPLDGERVPGAVGKPFPGVTVRIADNHEEGQTYDTIATADSHGTEVTPGKEEISGELLIKGDNVFKEYWNKPKATFDTFTHDGWFKTGDTAVYKDNVFKIVGRTSVDVIKSGGYKISALDIERHLLSHPEITDVAVVGLPDETWGQIIAVALVTRDGKELDMEQLKSWAEDKMPTYQIPRIFKFLKVMPRNSMGKVNKVNLAKTVFSEYL